MKRWTGFLAVCALLAALTGCGGQQAASRSAGGSPNAVQQLLDQAAENGGSLEAAVPVADAAVLATDPAVPPTAVADVLAVDEQEEGLSPEDFAHDGIDLDLTLMSSTMVYGEVAGMMYLPDDYVGKTVRMKGQTWSEYYDETDTTYYSVIIADATACCAQGLEYVLSEGQSYPANDTEATVTGVFELYDEFGITYCRLADATVSV